VASVIGRPCLSSHQPLAHVEGHGTAPAEPLDDPAHLAHDLRPDAVAGKHEELLVGGHGDVLGEREGERARRQA